MERGIIFYLLLLGVALSVHALPRGQPEDKALKDPPREIPDSTRDEEDEDEDTMEEYSLADQDDALLNTIYGMGSYELEDILEELKHSNSTAALDKIMATGEYRERVARAVCHENSAYGGNGGVAFADPCFEGIKEIVLCSGCCYPSGQGVIYSLQVKYRRSSGSTFLAPRHGQDCTNPHRITLGNNDKIVAVVMLASDVRVQSLAFLIQSPSGLRLRGPYGSRTYGTLRIIKRNNIVSFYGRSGAHLDSLGFSYR